MTTRKKTPNRGGRPPMEKEKRLSATIGVSLTKGDHERIYAHCEKNGLGAPGSWIRSVILGMVK